MAITAVTAETFDQTLAEHPIVVLDFWATWCGPCRSYGPVFEAVSNKHPDIFFGKVDTDAQQELAGAFGIQSIPSTVFLRDKVALHLQPGALRPEQLEALITEVRNIDMETVRAEIAAQKDGDED